MDTAAPGQLPRQEDGHEAKREALEFYTGKSGQGMLMGAVFLSSVRFQVVALKFKGTSVIALG